MILLALVLLPLLGGLLAYLMGRFGGGLARLTGILTLALTLVAALVAWPLSTANLDSSAWMIEVSYPWISSIGASFHFGMDGLSYVLVLLSLALSFIAIVSLSETPKRHEGLFIFLLLTTLSGIVGVFLSVDLLLFFLFWEIMLVPLYFLILLFGEDQRQKAATRFLILTQSSGLVLLLSIVFLHVSSGQNTFAFDGLVGVELPPSSELIVALGFFAAFLIKLPCVPFHFWMPSIFSSAPISALMAGILIKTSAYGFIRFSKFSFPLFPHILDEFAPYMIAIGLFGMLYGAFVAFSQTDIKKILAYSTISHVGLILAGLFSQNTVAMNGVMILVVTQAISTGGLLMICNHVHRSTNHKDLTKLSGLFSDMPSAGVLTIILVMASIGLPGLGNFVGEWLVLLGIFQVSPWFGACAATGIVFSAAYMLRFLHAIFFGEKRSQVEYRDIGAKSLFLHTLLVLVLIVIGFYPSIVIDTVSASFYDVSAMSTEDEANS